MRNLSCIIKLALAIADRGKVYAHQERAKGIFIKRKIWLPNSRVKNNAV